MKEKKIVCSVCGAELEGEAVFEFDGQTYCRRCFNERTVICDCCRDRILRSNAVIEDDITLCAHCREYSYVNCEDCGCLIHRDEANYHNDYPYCDDCYENLAHSVINPYDYKSPEPIFYGSGDLFYGIELEIDEGDILKLMPNGETERYGFEYNDYSYRNCNWWDCRPYAVGGASTYIDDLKAVANYQGYSSEDIDMLLENGFAPEEIEEYIYCMGEV